MKVKVDCWRYRGVDYVTSSQFSNICDVAISTVHFWCRKGMPYMPVEKIYMIPFNKAIEWVYDNAPRVVRRWQEEEE